MAGTVIADAVQAASTSQLVIKNGVALTPPTINDVNGTQIGTFCRAWVNFDGTGTVAIRGSFNVSSITDNGTGDYTVNFTNAMPDANYSIVMTGANRYGTNNPSYVSPASAISGANVVESAPTTTSTRLVSYYNSTLVALDAKYIFVAIFR